MADYFMEFSQVLPNLTDDELDWLRRQLEIVHVFGAQEFIATNLPPDLDLAQADWSAYRIYRPMKGKYLTPKSLASVSSSSKTN